MRATAVAAVLLIAGIVALAPRGLAELDYFRANRHYQAGDVAKARSTCESALRRNPAHAGARALLKSLRAPRLLESCGNRPEDTAPYDMDFMTTIGFRWLELGDPGEAETMFRRVLELADTKPGRISYQSRKPRALEGLERIAAMREDR